jgi:hypothetical protein
MTFRTGLTEEEEEKHVRRGAWLALPLLPFLLLFICGIFALTPGGQVALADLLVQVTFDGVPVLEDAQISYTRGFTGVAKASCALARQNPKPQNYQASQERLATEYQSLVGYYEDSWTWLKRGGGNVEPYDPPADIPSDLLGGTRTYCR